MRHNPTTFSDGYKLTHWLQRPENLTSLTSYMEFRKGGLNKANIHWGLTGLLHEYFLEKVTKEDIINGEKRCYQTFGTTKYYAKDIWEKVRKLGYFPLKVRSVKEGNLVPTGNALFTIEATESWFAPMVSHFEDILMWSWITSGVATRIFNIRKNIIPSHEKSVDNPFYGFSVNDFGMRGSMLGQHAAFAGAAHLIFFDGSDNMPAADLIENYYGRDNILKSVWATEHSVATAFGPGRGEIEYVLTQLYKAGPEAMVSMVIDSYDADNFMKNVAGHPEVLALIKKRPGRTVWRPDSNDPLINVCKYSDVLSFHHGFHLNDKEHRVLNDNVGIIQGDGMNEISIPSIFNDYIKTGWSAENFVTGSGGGLLTNGLTRDTDRAAIKACHAVIDGIEVDICKVPQSDLTKSSKKGKVKLHKAGNSYSTLESSKMSKIQFDAYSDEMETVFENGQIREVDFLDVRKIANSYL